MNKKVN